MNARSENKIILTMSPLELRLLADKMEERWSQLRLGQSCFVDILSHEPRIDLYLDQEYFHILERARNSGSKSEHSTQQAQTAITPGVAVVCSNRECDWRDKYGMCSHVDGKCDKHYILNPA